MVRRAAATRARARANKGRRANEAFVFLGVTRVRVVVVRIALSPTKR
jgi:hypothetical protein